MAHSLADLITQLQADAARVASERKTKTAMPQHRAVGKVRYSGLPEHHIAYIGSKCHTPMLYEERSHPD